MTNQTGCAFNHPSRPGRGAESATYATERNQVLVAAARADHANEAHDSGRADLTGWHLEDMLALDMEARGAAGRDDDIRDLYGFDIDRYKRTPDWLNARHWANPELWNRYRW